jgi:hypothetical protein
MTEGRPIVIGPSHRSRWRDFARGFVRGFVPLVRSDGGNYAFHCGSEIGSWAQVVALVAAVWCVLSLVLS